MRLMSNNQWKCDGNCDAWRADGLDCSAPARVKGLLRAYEAILPDAMGLQEVSQLMAHLMMDRLGSLTLSDGTPVRYEYISGGDTPIVYRRDRLKLLESGFFLYDEAVPGLEGAFNNNESKSYAWAAFEDRRDGQRFAMMSTHLWWKSGRPESATFQAGSNVARAYQIRLASARMDDIMARYDCPGVLMGDLNASVHSLCLEAAFEEGWRDVHDLAVGERDETKGHHPCGPAGFSRGEPGTFDQAIDHILLKAPRGARVERFGRLSETWFDAISDHYPLYADITF